MVILRGLLLSLLIVTLQLPLSGQSEVPAGTEVNYKGDYYTLTEIPHLDTALKYEGVKEKSGKNDGYWPAIFLKYVGIRTPANWCAAFASWCMGQCEGILNRLKTPLAQKFITSGSINAWDVLRGIRKVPAGSLVIWKKYETIFGHVGFNIYIWSGKVGYTIEGNVDNRIARKIREIEPTAGTRIIKFTVVEYRQKDIWMYGKNIWLF